MFQYVEIELGGKKLSIETGEMAKQADGAVIVRYGDTVLIATAVASKQPKPGVDFLPLSVDYREKMYAAGKIPGGFFKREGRPTEKEILVSRLIDRPLRPIFPKGLTNEIQILCSTLSYDSKCNPDVIAIIAASAAVSVSSIPFNGPVAGVKVGRINGALVINPSIEEEAKSDMSLIMAGTKDSIVMIESGLQEVSEEDVVDAIIFGHNEIKNIVSMQEKLAKAVNKEKFILSEPKKSESNISAEIKKECYAKIKNAVLIRQKLERQNSLDKILTELLDKYDNDQNEFGEEITSVFNSIEKEALRMSILEDGIRGDGRDTKQIRSITIRTDILPRTHGSVLFTRGETQALVVATLGTSSDEQRLDNLEGSSSKNFMLHYNFPPFCVGEAKFSPGPGRREIGHGALAERAIISVLPPKEVFPYSIRIVSDILESNGSSSMASVCGASLSLMNAGVPIKGSVAGIAMGLIAEGDKTAILSDITGQEDHLGDMDFKVAGTRKGITALQMDIKISGITKELMESALNQAKEGRLHILDKMDEVIPSHKSELSDYAPRITKIQIKEEKIKDLIGPGGKMIRSIIERTGVNIDIADNGLVLVSSNDPEASKKAIELINNVTQDPEIGRIYNGKVKKIMDFGAFVEIVPGKDGLVHISQLADYRVMNVTDVVKEGDEIKVKVLDIDSQGKIKLSLKEALADLEEN